jgi:photosystem II stability/assembly factor-like uncharacterized protein
MWSRCSIALTLAAISTAAAEPDPVLRRIPGLVTRLAFDDTRNGRMVVNGELLETSDGGASWAKSSQPRLIQQGWAKSLTQPGWKGWATQHAKAGTVQFWQIDARHGAEVRDDEILVSADAGQTWNPAIFPSKCGESVVARRISVHFRGSRGFLSVPGGPLFVSEDYGATWCSANVEHPVKPASGPAPDEPFVFLSATYGYLTLGGNTIYETRDGGRNWHPYVTGDNEYFTAIACYASDCWAAASEARLLHWNAAAALH